MAEAVIMPRQGQSVESCIITAILKQPGDSVSVGDILFSYETDKSSFEEEAKVAGTLLGIFAEVGDDVPCLDVVMAIGTPGEDISTLKSTEVTPAAADFAVAAPAAEIIGKADSVVTVSTVGDRFLSPRARTLAEKTRADISKAEATGPNGRIIERDVKAAVSAGYRIGETSPETAKTPASAPIPRAAYEDVKLTNIRKIIAKSMHASLSESAQLTLNSSFDATNILAFRKNLKENGETLGLANITLNDIVLYAAAKTLKNHRDLNAHFLGDTIRYFSGVNLGIAVDTDRGLMVPVLFGADSYSLSDFANESKKLINDARKGSISPDKLSGSTFTVTNLGALGIESFTPVINPPETGILGVNAITRRIKNGDTFYDAMSLSLTFDHRALDGAPAARFLKDLCVNLENFSLLLAK
ncbi:dihydrolipoamide acetyltransferase component of pyruvate dehydrogenase complex [Clostridia bacterium]|nr:dihydrolipoamide acetyltransferase component of pyruvate dehydrogenase complex [Clostridia bacterium]